MAYAGVVPRWRGLCTNTRNIGRLHQNTFAGLVKGGAYQIPRMHMSGHVRVYVGGLYQNTHIYVGTHVRVDDGECVAQEEEDEDEDGVLDVDDDCDEVSSAGLGVEGVRWRGLHLGGVAR